MVKHARSRSYSEGFNVASGMATPWGALNDRAQNMKQINVMCLERYIVQTKCFARSPKTST
eukprot:5537668-Pyramimonas_sp.AAC.1